ncbi:MAG: TolC family protein [Gemmatimonadota bacterium]
MAPRAPAADNAAGAGAARPAAAWTLDAVVRIALSHHPLVSRADAETRAAEARRGQARSAYYPTIGLATGYSRARGFSVQSRESATVENESVQGTLTQVLADFGRRSASLDRASALRDAFRESGRSVRQDVAFAAKVAYFDVLRTGRILAVQRDTVAQRESLVGQSRAYYEAGIRARIDVARSEANLYQARADLASAESALKVARITLLQRMGVDWPQDYELSYNEAAGGIDGGLADWIREAEGNRAELKALLAQQRAEEDAVRAARAERNPVLTGAGGYGYAADAPPLQENYDVSVVLAVPVFTGFLVRDRIAESEALLASARAAVTDERRIVRLEVEQAALAVQETNQRIEARRKEKEASDENLRLATARYQVGAGDIIEMIDAQVQAARSETTLIEALYDQEVATARLLRAIGRETTGREPTP